MRCLRHLPLAFVADVANGFAPDDANSLMQLTSEPEEPEEHPDYEEHIPGWHDEMPPKKGHHDYHDDNYPPGWHDDMPPKEKEEAEKKPWEDEEECILPHDFKDWELCGGEWSNNLAEKGSEADAKPKKGRKSYYQIFPGQGQEIRYKDVITDGDEDIDLVVSVEKGSIFKCYNPKDNGKPSGKTKTQSCFGQINVMTNSSAVFDFEFQNRKGEPHVVDNFVFTIYDVDQETKKDHEFVEFIDAPSYYWTSNETDGHNGEVHKNPSAIERIEDTYRFQSMKKGDSKDNPNSLEQLEHSRKKRAMTMTAQYNHRSNFRVRFGHVAYLSQGRKFLFGGRVPHFGCPKPTPTTTPEPVCPDFPGASFNWEACEKGGGAPRLPITNNLGGRGPHYGDPQEIRFAKVAQHGPAHDKKWLDLVVTNASEYFPWNITRNNVMTDENFVGIRGCFGVINLKHNSTVKLDFTFQYHEGEGAVPKFTDKDTFVFSLWDFDHSHAPGNREVVAISTEHIDGKVHVGNQVDAVYKDQHETGNPLNESALVVSSKEFGDGDDNPLDDLVAGTELAEKHVSMQLKGTPHWQISLSAVEGAGGRNFMFYGCRSH